MVAPAAVRRAPLPQDLMRKVRRIEISTKRLVDQGVAGEYHSVFKGRGLEFAEVRPYQPGDDVRTIDWNVTARMGSPFVKQFVESRDLTVFLVIDASGSLDFGSKAILKRELAAEVAALLAFAALRNQDRVGAALVGDRVERFLAPARSRNQVLRLVREILAHRGAGATDLDAAVPAVLRNLKQRSVLFLISDFLETPFSRALKAAAARHDTIVVEIRDPREAELPRVGPIPLLDAETAASPWHRRRRRPPPERRRAEEHRRLSSLSSRLGIDRLELSTDRPYLAPLVAFFERRRRRLSR
ncbi:MAG: DUF58 domain-containing protein [Thermoanaerobaculia bacterium]